MRLILRLKAQIMTNNLEYGLVGYLVDYIRSRTGEPVTEFYNTLEEANEVVSQLARAHIPMVATIKVIESVRYLYAEHPITQD